MASFGSGGHPATVDPFGTDVQILLYTTVTFYSILTGVNIYCKIVTWARLRSLKSQQTQRTRYQPSRSRSGLKQFLQRNFILPALAGDTHAGTRSILGMPGVSLPTRLEAICLTFYFFLNIILGITQLDMKDSQVLTLAAHRQAMFGLFNVLILAAHTGRNSPVNLLTGMSHSTTMLIHRWLGRLAGAQISLHGLLITYRTFSLGGLAALKMGMSNSAVMWGSVAMTATGIILFQAASPFRRAFYEAFHLIHVSLAVIFFVGAWKHRAMFVHDTRSLAFLKQATIFVVAEHIVRLLRLFFVNVPFGKMYGNQERFTSARLQAIAGATRIRISVPKVWSVTPGQHVYLHIPMLGPLQSHPFTVAWVEDGSPKDLGSKRPLAYITSDEDDNHMIQLIVKANDGFTRTLLNKAQESPNCKVTCAVEGPYGSPSNDFDLFDEVLLICGGIGVTYALMVMKNHIQKQEAKKNKQRMTLVWVVRYDSEIAWAQDHLDYLIERSDGLLKISIHVTRPPSRAVDSPMGKLQMEMSIVDNRTTFILPVKPNLPELVKHAVADRVGTLAIVSCGPGRFADSIRKAMVVEIENGVTYIEEAFSW